MERRDVGVVEGGKELGFPLEPSQALGTLGEVLREYLYGHFSIQGGIEGFPDNAHPPFADFLDEAVMGEHLAGLERQGILYIGRPLSASAESNIFSLQNLVLATVPSGEPPPKQTQDKTLG